MVLTGLTSKTLASAAILREISSLQIPSMPRDRMNHGPRRIIKVLSKMLLARRPLGGLTTGIVLVVLACFLFVTQDSISKQLMLTLTVVQVIWGRFLCQTAVITSYLVATGGTRFLHTRHPWLQILRGMCQVGTTGMVYISLPHVPIGDITAIVFCSPIIVTVLSVIFLKEKIGKHRVAAVIIGFVGVYLIVLPGSSETSIYHLLTLAAAFTNAMFIMMTRRLAGPEETSATQFNTTTVGMVVFTLILVFGEGFPPLEWAPLFLVMGVLAAVGHFCMVKAFAYASASVLSPYLYAQVIFAAAFSVFWFGDTLRPTMLAGTALLIASGMYIWWRERTLGIQRAE